MLSLLFSLEVESGESAQVLFADGLIDGGAATDTLPVVVRGVSPPVRLHLHVAEDHVLDRGW